MATNGSTSKSAILNGAGTIDLNLHISDAETREALSEYEDERERHEFAVSALKIGVIALRQAQGQIDADKVRQEGERFISQLGHDLSTHQKEVTGQINSALKEYFDPDSGRFNDRIKRLIENDGELERVIHAQVGTNGSELTQTLTAHLGIESPLMKKLDPKASDGLISVLTQTTEDVLDSQRKRILAEFSLDNGDGALSRLIAELNAKHGEVGKSLEERIGTVIGEFSLDKDDSALSRLMNRVEQAQQQISSEFSLDEDGSALARMRKELLDGIEKQRQTNEKFQGEVIQKLTEMTVSKRESERSTRHGLDFEDAVFEFINKRSQQAGDIATHKGNTTGSIRNNKKGDVVITLSPDHVAADAKIVIEAKQDASYTLERALSEIVEARKNRDAGIGLFVFSARNAPSGLEPFSRYGEDIVVVWDAEDPASDVVFDSGLSVAKAISVQAKSRRDEMGADLEEIGKAILEIERQIGGLDEITKAAGSIEKQTDKIINRARIMRNGLKKQIGILDERVGSLK